MVRLAGSSDEMTVSAFLEVLAPDVRRVVSAVRKLVRAAAPAATETVLWGSLSYHLPMLGGRVKGAVCQITPRHNHVEVGFIHGVLLADSKHLLRGSGKSKRTVRVEHVENLRDWARRAHPTRGRDEARRGRQRAKGWTGPSNNAMQLTRGGWRRVEAS
jgi:hypothetical protein